MTNHDRAKAIYEVAADHAAAGNVEEATALYELALAMWRVDPADQAEAARTLHNLALLYDSVGRPERAAALWAEAESVARKLRTATGVGK